MKEADISSGEKGDIFDGTFSLQFNPEKIARKTQN
jgi:hypothetical protein